jgi:hypothetical protein
MDPDEEARNSAELAAELDDAMLEHLSRIAAAVEDLAKDSRSRNSRELWADLHAAQLEQHDKRRAGSDVLVLLGVLILVVLYTATSEQVKR